WLPFELWATNAPFTIYNGAAVGSGLATVPVDQTAAPADFTDAGVGWKDLGGPYAITGTTLTVRLSDLTPHGIVIAHPVRTGRLSAGPMPATAGRAGGLVLAANNGLVDFGVATPGSPLTKTFTVHNAGTATLNLGAISLPAGYTLQTGLGSATLALGASTT